jgi:hypothetical protein
MGIFSKISKAFKKVVKFATGGLIGGHSSSGQSTAKEPVPAPELGFVNADTSNTTESESEKQQLTKGKKRGKKSLKINMFGPSSGRNIV